LVLLLRPLKNSEAPLSDKIDSDRSCLFTSIVNSKAKYNHEVGARGGIEIVEVLSGRGAPEGDVVIQVRNLAEAEDCYLTLRARLDSFTTE
jgi:hypothetical protein